MVAAIEFAVRDFAGGTQHGNVAGDNQGNFIQVGSGDSVSLNLSRASVVGYEQQGQDLLIKLADGRSVVLSGYFNEAPGDVNHLYLSSDGQIVEVMVSETGDGVLFAEYGPVQGWDKWSPLDDLRFANADAVTEMAAASNEPAGMLPLVPGLLGGFGGWGAAAAVAGGAAVLTGGGGKGRKPPTVDPQTADPLTTNTVAPTIKVTGTGEPGDAVSVNVGGKIQTTTIGTDGKWSVTYPTTGLPADGTHVAQVVVTPPKGAVVNLTGPSFVIDMIPPAVSTTAGTTMNNDVENLAEYANGVSISGNGEVGAKVSVLVNGHTQNTTVGADGKWTVTFTQAQIPGGDYHTIPAVVTATDALGNKTVINRDIAIDTVPHPISVTNVGGDNLINLSESQSGYAVNGTSTAGAVMTVVIGSETRTVTAGADGKWSASFTSASITQDGSANVTVSTVDAAGNASTSTFPFRVDTVASLAVNMVAGNDIVSGAENGGSIAVTGTSEIGSRDVRVSWNGTTISATVDPATGNWTANFPANLFGSIQSTATNISVTASDAAGNTSSATRAVNVDTLAQVAMGNGQIGDDRLVASETGGFALTGTSDPFARVTVVFEGQTREVVASGSGTWSANFSFGSFGQMTRTSTVQVTAQDQAGNTATTSHSINIDTEVTNFRLTAVSDLTSLAAGADAVNNAEAQNGVDISGTVEPFSTVTVMWGNVTLPPITTDASGVWVARVPASAVPSGETFVNVTATAIDRYGNASGTLTQAVEIDRVVTPLTRQGSALIGGDGRLNAEEVAQGLTLTGTVEPGSAVRVSLNDGTPFTTTAGANGIWTMTIPATGLPQGNDIPVTVKVSATDWVGNIHDLPPETIRIDTVVPGDPVRVGDAGAGNSLYGIATAISADDYSYHTVNAAGVVAEITPAAEYNGAVNVNGSNVNAHWAMFGAEVPDGTYLVVRNEDAAGNEASTLYLRNTTGEVTVDLSRSGLSQFDFGTIDLSAADATLTITDAQVLALTGADKQLTVAGGADDVVNLVGGRFVSASDGYKLYALGSSGATVLVEDDITNVNLTGL